MIGDVFGCLICMPALLSWARWIDARNNPGARNLAPPGFSERRRAPRAPGPVAMRADSRLPPVMRLSREQWLFILVSVAASALGWAITRDKVPVPVVGFLAMPLLVWAAIKFPPLFVHSAAMACGLITITLQLTAPGNISLDRATNTASLFLFLLSVSSLTLIVNVVVQQQRRLAGELAFRAQQERLELMLQAATDAVISFDEHGALSYWNPAAERLFGRKAAQALGRPVQEILPLPKLVAAATDGISALCDANDDLFSGRRDRVRRGRRHGPAAAGGAVADGLPQRPRLDGHRVHARRPHPQAPGGSAAAGARQGRGGHARQVAVPRHD